MVLTPRKLARILEDGYGFADGIDLRTRKRLMVAGAQIYAVAIELTAAIMP
jgi:hypothetical protein